MSVQFDLVGFFIMWILLFPSHQRAHAYRISIIDVLYLLDSSCFVRVLSLKALVFSPHLRPWYISLMFNNTTSHLQNTTARAGSYWKDFVLSFFACTQNFYFLHNWDISRQLIVKLHWAEYFFCISRNKIYKIDKDSGQKTKKKLVILSQSPQRNRRAQSVLRWLSFSYAVQSVSQWRSRSVTVTVSQSVSQSLSVNQSLPISIQNRTRSGCRSGQFTVQRSRFTEETYNFTERKLRCADHSPH